MRRSRGKARVVPRRELPVALALFVGAWLVRLLVISGIRSETFFLHLQTEPLRYQRWAEGILVGQWPSFPLDAGPGYPLLVAAIFAAFGPGLLAVAHVQALLDAASAVLAARTMARLGSPRAGLATGLLWALFGPAIYYVTELLPVTVALFLLWASVSLSEAPPGPLRDRKVLAWGASGACLAAAIAVRTEIVLVVPLFLLRAWRASGRKAAALAVAPLLLFVAVTASVNYAASRHLVPLTIGGGFNLWLGNHPAGDGVSPFLTPEQQRRADEIEGAPGADPVTADRRYLAEAFRDAASRPATTMGRLGKKLLWLVSTRELPNTCDIDWELAHSGLFRLPLVPLHFGLLLALAVLGAGAVARDPRLWWTRAIALAGAVSCVLFLCCSRFRALLFPALVASAGLGVAELPLVWQSLRGGLRAAWLRTGVALVALGLANTNLLGVRDYRIPQIDSNTGVLEAEAGHPRAAIGRFRSALAGAPWNTEARLYLARVLFREGCLDDADQVLAAGEALGSASSGGLADARRIIRRLRETGAAPARPCELASDER